MVLAAGCGQVFGQLKPQSFTDIWRAIRADGCRGWRRFIWRDQIETLPAGGRGYRHYGRRNKCRLPT